MPRDQKDTYTVALGEQRIAEIRNISKLTGLQQSEILRYMWDTYKLKVIETLLADREQSLETKLADIKQLIDTMSTAVPEELSSQEEEEYEDDDEPDVDPDII